MEVFKPMKPEDFGVYELQRYITAEYEFRKLDAERETAKEAVFCSLFPQWKPNDTGDITYFRSPTEDAVIRLVEIDEATEEAAQVFKRKSSMLRQAMKILTPGEREAFDCMVWGEVSQQAYETLEELAHTAVKKLCLYIGTEKAKEKTETIRKHKESLKQQAKEYKQSLMGVV